MESDKKLREKWNNTAFALYGGIGGKAHILFELLLEIRRRLNKTPTKK